MNDFLRALLMAPRVFAPADEGAGGATDDATDGATDTKDDATPADGGDKAAAPGILGDATPPTDGGTSGEGEDKTGDDKPEGKTDEPDPLDAVPEDGKYTLELDEGMELDATVAEAANPVFKELGITARQANGLANFFGSLRAQEEQARHDGAVQQAEAWVKETNSDPAYQDVGTEVAFREANRALTTFGSEKLTQLLRTTGLANHPEMVRFCYNASKALAEDKTEMGGNAGAADAPMEERLYKTTPTSKKG